jgi:hypothetical protein
LITAAQRKELIFYPAILFSKLFSQLLKKKVGKLPASHRYNHLPLLPSDPGGIQQELIAQDLPGAKVEKFIVPANFHPDKPKFPPK